MLQETKLQTKDIDQQPFTLYDQGVVCLVEKKWEEAITAFANALELLAKLSSPTHDHNLLQIRCLYGCSVAHSRLNQLPIAQRLAQRAANLAHNRSWLIPGYVGSDKSVILTVMQQFEEKEKEKSYVDMGGMCFGFAHQAMLTAHAGPLNVEFAKFDRRLKTLGEAAKDPKKFKTTIEEVRKKIGDISAPAHKEVLQELKPEKSSEEMSPNENKNWQKRVNAAISLKVKQRIAAAPELDPLLVEMPAFFDVVSFVHFSSGFQKIFPEKASTYIQNLERVLPHIKSHNLEEIEAKEGELSVVKKSIAAKFFYFYELEIFFQKFGAVVDSIGFKSPITFVFKDDDHVIMVAYDPQNKNWFLVDSNLFPCVFQASPALAAAVVFDAFQAENVPYVNFSAEIFALQSHHAAIENILSICEQDNIWQSIHQLEKEKLDTLQSMDRVRWLRLAAKCGDVKVVKILLEAYPDLHEEAAELLNVQLEKIQYADNPLDSECNILYCAIACGHGEVVKLLLENGFKERYRHSEHLNLAVKLGYAEVVKELFFVEEEELSAARLQGLINDTKQYQQNEVAFFLTLISQHTFDKLIKLSREEASPENARELALAKFTKLFLAAEGKENNKKIIKDFQLLDKYAQLALKACKNLNIYEKKTREVIDACYQSYAVAEEVTCDFIMQLNQKISAEVAAANAARKQIISQILQFASQEDNVEHPASSNDVTKAPVHILK